MSPCIAIAATPRRGELLGEPVGAALGADEDEREPAVGLEQLDQPVELVLGRDRDERVVDDAVAVARRRARRPRSGSGCRVYARASSPTSPSSVAEKSIVWRSRGSAAEDLLDLRAEAHVEHPVGLVEDEDPDVVERDRAGARSGPAAGPASRRRCARPSRRFACARDRRAAVDGATREALRAGELLELVGDLERELARRHEHERGGRRAVGVGALDDRDRERERLARAGRRLARARRGRRARRGATRVWMRKGSWMPRVGERLARRPRSRRAQRKTVGQSVRLL